MSLHPLSPRRLARYAPYGLAAVILVIATGTTYLAYRLSGSMITLQSDAGEDFIARLVPVVIGLAFWLTGVVVKAYAARTRESLWFFLFCQLMCLLLLSGDLSATYPVAEIIYSACCFLIGPVMLHTHMALTSMEAARLDRRVLVPFYGIAVVLAAVQFASRYFPTGTFTISSLFVRQWVFASLVIVLIGLILVYVRSASLEIRRKAGIVLLSNLLAFSPFLLFSLVPNLLFGQLVLSFQASFGFFVFIPLGYSYAILYYRLLHLEPAVDRAAAYSLVTLTVSGIYGICYLLFYRVLPRIWHLPLAADIVLAVVLILALQPLYRFMLASVYRFLYGTWYDDRSALRQISQSLNQSAIDAESIAYTLCLVIERTLSLEYAVLLLDSGALLTSKAPIPVQSMERSRVSALFDSLQARTGRDLGAAKDLVSGSELSVAERAQLWGPKPQLWLLLNGSLGWLGLLVLGPRRGGELEKGDLETLELLARQARVALENVSLLKQVRSSTGQITQLHRQLIQVREDERRGLARELHDQTIQSLYGVNYHLSGLKSKSAEQIQMEVERLRGEVSEILEDLRRLCADLRPPSLDSLGIAAALTALVRKARKTTGLKIAFSIEGDEDLEVPEDVSVALYRVLQEALSNVAKHAQATRTRVTLFLSPVEVRLSIEDDGCGFEPPQRLSALTQTGHFGLAGIQERVSLAGGRLDIVTAPGEGCRMLIVLPLHPDEPAPTLMTEGKSYGNPSLDR